MRRENRNKISTFLTTSIDRKIYAFGWWGIWPNDKDFSTVMEYDPVIDKWTNKDNMPSGRGYFSTGVVNDKIYLIGGRGKRGQVLSTVEEFDPKASDLGFEAKGN